MTRYTRRGWPVNEWTVGGTGLLVLLAWVLTPDSTPWLILIGVVLILLALRLRYAAST
ncbi:membrane protein [Mycobacterium phage Zenteno07]|nr:membrane protein [Mycobacterium phage Zenteno07]